MLLLLVVFQEVERGN